MKMALIVNEASDLLFLNIRSICSWVMEAASQGAELALFSEAALTGLINNGSVVHDLQMGLTQDSEKMFFLRRTARYCGIDICLGYFELADARMYNSAIYIGADGNTQANYRRRTRDWRDPLIEDVYGEGTRPCLFNTRFGRTSILINRDFFDDRIVQETAGQKPELLLLPFALRLAEDETEIVNQVSERVRMIGATTLFVNYVNETSPGGACVFSPGGRMEASMGKGHGGILYYDYSRGEEA